MKRDVAILMTLMAISNTSTVSAQVRVVSDVDYVPAARGLS